MAAKATGWRVSEAAVRACPTCLLRVLLPEDLHLHRQLGVRLHERLLLESRLEGDNGTTKKKGRTTPTATGLTTTVAAATMAVTVVVAVAAAATRPQQRRRHTTTRQQAEDAERCPPPRQTAQHGEEQRNRPQTNGTQNYCIIIATVVAAAVIRVAGADIKIQPRHDWARPALCLLGARLRAAPNGRNTVSDAVQFLDRLDDGIRPQKGVQQPPSFVWYESKQSEVADTGERQPKPIPDRTEPTPTKHQQKAKIKKNTANRQREHVPPPWKDGGHERNADGYCRGLCFLNDFRVKRRR